MTLCQARGIDLSNVEVLALAGATNVSQFLEPLDLVDTVLVLCDEAEQAIVEKAFAAAGREQGDIYVCRRDLEDEMIEALGTDQILDVIDKAGESTTFARMSSQPAQRNRSLEDRLHRFIGVRAGRKVRYGTLLAERLTEGITPAPLASLLERLAK